METYILSGMKDLKVYQKAVSNTDSLLGTTATAF